LNVQRRERGERVRRIVAIDAGNRLNRLPNISIFLFIGIAPKTA
jgi:hypothetical protein